MRETDAIVRYRFAEEVDRACRELGLSKAAAARAVGADRAQFFRMLSGESMLNGAATLRLVAELGIDVRQVVGDLS